MRASLLAGVVAFGWFQAASAVPITATYSFDLKDFVPSSAGVVPPINEVSGTVTINYDPTLTYSNQTSGIYVNSLSGVTVDGPIAFSTYHVSGNRTLLYFGGLPYGAPGIGAGTNDLVLAIDFTSVDSPDLLLCNSPYEGCGSAPAATTYGSGYTVAQEHSAFFVAQTANLSVAVPEPATLALLSLPLGIAGLVTARRKRAAT